MARSSPAADRRPSLPIRIALWANAVVAVALLLVGLVDHQLQASDPATLGSVSGDLYFVIVSLALVGGLGAMGALIASRRSRNPIGWLFAGAATTIAVPIFAGGYADLSVHAHGGSLPGTAFMAWLSGWPMPLALAMLLIFVPLLFPTGSLPSRRWWPVAVLGILGPIPPLLSPALRPGPLPGYPGIRNPFGVAGSGPLLDNLVNLSNALAPPLFLLVVLSVVLRYRRGGAVERQQIKWFAYTAALAAISFAMELSSSGTLSDVAWLVGFGALAGMPISIGIAILRYRLFDIDHLINRTIVYVLLTALLVMLEIGGVLVLRTLLSPLTGETSIAVAATTLAVVALFQPLRRRIQAGVDRRFYRSRYDAARVVSGFTARLRDEVELDHLTAELRATIAEALRPAAVSVWLRQRHD